MYKLNGYKTNEIMNLKSKEIQQKITIANAGFKNNKKGNTSKKKDARGFDLESFSFNLWTLVP